MAPPGVPGIPGTRLPMQSEDQGDEFERAARMAHQAEQVAIAVEQKLGERIGKLEGSVLELGQRLAEMELLISKAKAFAASTTVKIVMAMLGSGGLTGLIMRMTEKPPAPTQVVMQRGVLERTIETTCNPLPNVDDRIKCAARVAAEQTAGPR